MVISAISDGILNNDAFKHCDGETKNESWTKIIKDLSNGSVCERKYFHEIPQIDDRCICVYCNDPLENYYQDFTCFPFKNYPLHIMSMKCTAAIHICAINLLYIAT